LIRVFFIASNTASTGDIATNINAAWTFDNTTADVYGVYNGQLMNGAGYSAISTTIPYLGQGQALNVQASSNQSFQVTSPFLSLANTSFTVEAWIYSTSYTGNNGVFSQCQCASCADQCFYFLVQSARLYAGFALNDVNGLLTLTASTWYHIAFVYNYGAQQQILYLNGVQDNIKSNSAAYQGTSGNIIIGSTQLSSTTNFFNGYIDNVRIVTRAKSATEVLSDASLIAYYSFDLPYPTIDNGVNGLNGSSVNTAVVTGRVNEAMRFTGSSSYFQAYGFYQLGFGVNYNKPFSVSLWISPTSTSSCSFLQQSTTATGGSCFNQLGIWTYTGNTAQIVAQGYAWPTIYGPFITLNTWMHISWTFSLADGYRLYINGVYYGTTGYYSYGGTTGVITWIQVGYNFGCSSAYISNAPYQGSVDELYCHNRELSAAEVSALANP
jgi:hypothetical protein